MRTDVTIPNGLAWSPDGTILYWAESTRRTIYAFAAPGVGATLGAGRVFSDLAATRIPGAAADGQTSLDAAPDGAATDQAGFLWSAHWDGWRVVRYASDGRVDRVVELPVQRPTCCAFGGPDMRTLYITSAWEGLTPAERRAQPHAGDVLALEVETPGCRVASFGAPFGA
jgi:L-arabinonolactonase